MIVSVPPVAVDVCAWCGADQRNPPEVVEATGAVRSTLLVCVPGQYDGGLYFQCAACGWRWHRWPEADFRHRRAAPYVGDQAPRCGRGANALGEP